jgi:hypothetical protein
MNPKIQGFTISEAGAVIFLEPTEALKAASDYTSIGVTITWAELQDVLDQAEFDAINGVKPEHVASLDRRETVQ